MSRPQTVSNIKLQCRETVGQKAYDEKSKGFNGLQGYQKKRAYFQSVFRTNR